jgi:hypothetical protein
MTNRPIFDRLSHRLAAAGPKGMLAELAEYLRLEGRYHELFEARKLMVRQQLSLPWLPGAEDDRLPEPTRQALEDGLIAACQEVGLLLLRSGSVREGWHYLRVVGDRALVQHELASLEPTDANVDEFLELWVHEGLDFTRGFHRMLRHYGTCNSITTFESAMYGRSRQDRATGAGLIVEHVYNELRDNVQSHIQRRDGPTAASDNASLPDLWSGRAWLFADGTYHVDTTHLASVVRFARELDDPRLVRLGLELAQYGAQLDPSLQYPGDAPFEQLYPATCRYLEALLGQDQAAHLEYFRERAEAVDPREETTLAIETYIDLLARVGQPGTALHEALRLLPEGVQQTGRAPSLLELATASSQFAPLEQLARQRGDAVGFALCLLQAELGEP